MGEFFLGGYSHATIFSKDGKVLKRLLFFDGDVYCAECEFPLIQCSCGPKDYIEN